MNWDDMEKAADEATDAVNYLRPGQHKLVCAELSYRQHKGKDSYYFSAVVAQSDVHAAGEIVSISPLKPNPAQAQYESYAKRDARTLRDLICALWRVDESQFRQHVEQSFDDAQPVRGATVMVQATAKGDGKPDEKGRVFCDYAFFGAGDQSADSLRELRAKVEALPRFRAKVTATPTQPQVAAPVQQPPPAAQATPVQPPPPLAPPPQGGGNNGWG